jgi:RNA polymerase sigma-70 factor (ECF subfamily)
MGETVMDTRAAIVAEIPRLRRYARVLLRNQTAADDLVQDCLERALARLHLFQPGTNLRAWSPYGQDGEVEAAQGGGLLLRDLERALETLPDDQRTVVLLIGLEGLSYRDAADILSVPVGTVMSRLARGRERLRRFVEGEMRPSLRKIR